MPSAWWQRPHLAGALDATLVVSVFLVGMAGHLAARTDPGVEAAPISAAAAVFAAVGAAMLWGRRTRPLGRLGVLVAVAVLARAVVGEPGLFSVQMGVETMVLFHAIGSWSRRARLSLAVALASGVFIAMAAVSDGSGVLGAGAFALAVVAFPLAAGYAARARRQYLHQVEERLRQAEKDRDERARRAIEDERARIARELHDVVAHHVSLIGVQAGAARTTADRNPEASRAALAAIEQSSRDAVGEMRRLLDVLRPLDSPAERAPQPALHGLGALVERWRAAGFAIEAETVGLEGALPAALSLCAYRVVEESLTNVARHSLARQVRVRVAVQTDAVCVTVQDPGPAATALAPPGRGLVGMGERVGLFGGELQAGPTAAGGFAIEARLPRGDR